MTSPSNQRTPRLQWVIGTAVFSRLALTTAHRFLYPFAPVLSRGLGVSLSAITSLIAASQATGIVSIFLAPLGDYVGYRIMMLAGLLMLAIGMFMGGFLPFYGVVLIAVFFAGLGKGVFDPALQAYIGKHVPFRRRGLAIGVVEMSWAGSALIGIPMAGILIERFNWRAPFFALGGVALLGIFLLRRFMPSDREPPGNIHNINTNIWHQHSCYWI